jgi:hypothetical protein
VASGLFGCTRRCGRDDKTVAFIDGFVEHLDCACLRQNPWIPRSTNIVATSGVEIRVTDRV